ncbi:hypothetical protein LJR153_007351 [Paenibacillus sp. LjRoot153]|uniref:hypothetical protein n=1 Tax=Paenibacillus sp. LjRoot153 TaxID=3342270 RepID=UPI003ECE637F
MEKMSLVKCKNIEHAAKAAEIVGGFVVIGVTGSASWLDADTVPVEITPDDDVAAVCTASEARIGYQMSDNTETESTDLEFKIMIMLEQLANRAHSLPVNVSGRFLKHAYSELLFKYRWIAAKSEMFQELYLTAIQWRQENVKQITEKNQKIIQRALSEVENETVTALTEAATIAGIISDFAGDVIFVID